MFLLLHWGVRLNNIYNYLKIRISVQEVALQRRSIKNTTETFTTGLTWSSRFDSITRMLMIRLQRIGRKNDPSFRLVLTDKENSTKSGKFLEVLGSYDARKGKPVIVAERVKHWIAMGAQVSDTVHNLLVVEKIVEGKKINVLPKKTVPKKEEEAPKAESAPATPETTQDTTAPETAPAA